MDYIIINGNLIPKTYLQMFELLLKNETFGRFTILMNDGQIIMGFIDQPIITKLQDFDNITTIYLLREKPLINKLIELVRFGSQESKFFYNIKEIELYTDSQGLNKPEYIIKRPCLNTTNIDVLDKGRDKYDCTSYWDTNRPEPEFEKMTL
jgi:hypothetical protein